MAKFYSTIFNLVALFVILYIGVDLFYKIVRSQLKDVDTQEIAMVQIPQVKGHKGPALNDYGAVMARNIFGSLEKASEGVKPADIETLEPTALKIALLGTVTGDKQTAVAVIEERDKRRQGLYRVGDSVQDAIVRMILRGKVVLRVGDKDEILTMEESSSQRASSSSTEKEGRASRAPRRGTSITVKRSDIEKSLEDINKLLSQARIRPHFTDGSADGLAFSNIKAGSIFKKMGLKNGDIVQGVDDRPIESPDDVLSLYEKLESESSISLQINRKGRQETINYRLR